MRSCRLLTLLLTIMLVVTITGSVFTAIINPEIFLFGKKLAGEGAVIYLLTNALIGIVLLVLLLKNHKSSIILSTLYFGYNVLENYISFQTTPLLATLSLFISILALICNR